MIQINNLEKTYGDFHLNITIEIPEGRITGLIGKNGAGKSTTIKSILGLTKPDSGSVKVFGKEAFSLAAADRERMGVALSDSGFSTYLTVFDVAKILDILRDYLVKNEDRSILITSHISTDLESICDDIYPIHEGQVILHEETDVILSEYGVLKVDEETFAKMDHTYLLNVKKEMFGCVCLTGEKGFYMENYPEIVIEKCGIDDLILMLTGGRQDAGII